MMTQHEMIKMSMAAEVIAIAAAMPTTLKVLFTSRTTTLDTTWLGSKGTITAERVVVELSVNVTVLEVSVVDMEVNVERLVIDMLVTVIVLLTVIVVSVVLVVSVVVVMGNQTTA